VILWDDGTLVRYDSAARKMLVVSAGDMTFKAPDGTIVIDGKNLVLRTGKEGYFHTNHAGKATTITHKGGSAFESESWVAGAVVSDKGDNGFGRGQGVGVEDLDDDGLGGVAREAGGLDLGSDAQRPPAAGMGADLGRIGQPAGQAAVEQQPDHGWHRPVVDLGHGAAGQQVMETAVQVGQAVAHAAHDERGPWVGVTVARVRAAAR
jgi:hypothetical protein